VSEKVTSLKFDAMRDKSVYIAYGVATNMLYKYTFLYDNKT